MIVSRKNVRCENTQVLRETIAEEEEEEEEGEEEEEEEEEKKKKKMMMMMMLTFSGPQLITTCCRSRTGMDEIEDCLLINKGKRISYICVCCRIDLYDTI